MQLRIWSQLFSRLGKSVPRLAALGLVSGTLSLGLGSSGRVDRLTARVLAPGAGTQQLPKGVTMELIREGRDVYAGSGNCGTCHGASARGIRHLGSDLTDDAWAHADGSYPSILSRIERGVSAEESSTGVPMPPGGGSGLGRHQLEAVAAYVWALSHGVRP